MGLNVNQAKKMLKKAEENKLVHMTVFNWRFVPSILLMKELIDKGEVGSVRHVFFEWQTGSRINKESHLSWRFVRSEAGFGALADTGVHLIDLIHWILGDLKSVVSQMTVHYPEHKVQKNEYRKTEVEDCCSFLGKLNDRVQVLCHVTSVASSESLIRLEVYGDKGLLGVHLYPNTKDYYGCLFGGNGEKSLDHIIPIPERLKWKINPSNYEITLRSLCFARFAQQLVKAIRFKETASPSFFDGLKVQVVLEALTLSWKKKAWVDLE